MRRLNWIISHKSLIVETLPWQHAAPLHTTPASVLCWGNTAPPHSVSTPWESTHTHWVIFNTRKLLHNKPVAVPEATRCNKLSELLVLWMQILHFRQEVFILLRDEVALGEVTGQSGRTVIPHLRCRWWKETLSINTETHTDNCGIIRELMLTERIVKTGIITHTVIIKSFVFLQRHRTYTAQHKMPTLQLHSAGTATCNHTPWL